ncbi:prephenate dehydrogenase [candidate division KSB1 bacterium]|nr:prephenate dehydrogenase [candidate division KSB1 bacterium]
MDFKNICIVGVGLIGGSFAAALKQKNGDLHIIGVDEQSVVEKGIKLGLLNAGFPISELEDAAINADLVLLASPIKQIINQLKILPSILKKGALVTDVGSSKSQIVEIAESEFKKGAHFVGGHPMTGSEKRGIDAADHLLFENCYYVVTPCCNTPQKVIDRFVRLLEHIGAKVLFLDAETHDRIAATVSHLPQMLAVNLVNFVEHFNRKNQQFLKLAAGGFRDMTRIASSPFYMWQDICETNRDNILHVMDEFIVTLQQFRDHFESSRLEPLFERSARTRLSIPHDTKGFINPLYDVSVVVEDKPGIIAEIANTLAEKQINIRDIEVLKVRMLESGTLRLSFETEQLRKTAMELLHERGYICRKR